MAPPYWSAGGLALLATAALAGCGGSDDDAQAHTATATPSRARVTHRYEVAWLVAPTYLRAAPGGRRIARLPKRTRFGSPAALSVVGRRVGWLRVASDALPIGRRGWIPARRAELRGTDYDIRVDRSARRAVLRHDGRVVLRFRVAVGRPGNETPLGRFAVTDRLKITQPASPYGCCAIALTGHQTQLEPGWVGGDRLAIHGTNAPASVGHAVSLGCMRADERAVRRLMQRVPLGAPVFISA
jgi:hypothetical protein